MSFPFISVPELPKKTVAYTGFVSNAELISKMPRKMGLAAEDPRIGKMADKPFARRIGVAPSTVRRARHALNIPLFKPYHRDCEELILQQPDLGDVPDHIIATRLDVAKSYVQRVRTKWGIASTVGKNIGAEHSYVEKSNAVGIMMNGWGRPEGYKR